MKQMITFKTVYLVIYSTTGMRERQFDNEIDANTFAESVKGSVCPMNVKILPVKSKSYNKAMKQVKTFGY